MNLVFRHIFLFFLFVICSQRVFAQSHKIDSLREIANSLKGTEKIDALNLLAYEMFSFDFFKSKEISREARNLSIELKYDKGVAEAMINDAVSEWKMGHYSISIPEFKQSFIICKKMKLNHLQGFGLTYLGRNYESLGQLDSSQICYSQANDLLKDNLQPYYLSFLYLNLARLSGLKNEPARQLEYLQMCWSIREKMKNKKYLAHVGERIAAFYNDQGNYEKALSYLDKSQHAIGKDTIDNEEISVIYKQRGLVYIKQGKSKEALNLFYKSLKFYEDNHAPLNLINLHIDIGNALLNIGNYEISLKNYFTSLTAAEANHFEFEWTHSLFLIGWVYFISDQNTLAQDFAEKSLKAAVKNKFIGEEAFALDLLGKLADRRNQHKVAIDYFKKGLTIRNARNDRIGIASTLLNLGITFEKMGDFKNAEIVDLKGLAIEETLNNVLGIAQIHQNLGSLYTKMKQFQKASSYLEKGELASKNNLMPYLLVEIYRNKRDLLVAQLKYKEANDYSLLYEELKDSVHNNNLSNRIFALQYDLQLEKQKKEIKILSQQKDLQSDENRQQKIVIVISLAVLLAVSVVAYLIFIYYRRSKVLNRKIVEQNTEISVQRNFATEQNDKLIEAKIIIEGQNEEIKLRNENLEKEVEDRTKELMEYNQQLEQFAFISAHNLRAPVARILGLGNVLKLSPTSREEEESIIQKLIATTQELDNVVRDLNVILEVKKNSNANVSEINLEKAFRQIEISLEKEIVEANANLVVDFSKALTIYSVKPYVDSILINLVSNAIKYRNLGRPLLIHVKSEIRNNYVCLVISDNGMGIDLNLFRGKLFKLYSRFHRHVEGKGIGLYLVKTQVTAMGGKIEIESEVDKGTTFSVYIKISSSD